MKRKQFRLGAVLKHYEVQKQRADFDLQREAARLREIDSEIENLNAEIVALADAVGGRALNALSAAAWMACCRHSEHLGRRLENARVRRIHQMDAVARCNEVRKRWAIAEETLVMLRRKIDTANRQEEAHVYQVQLQEMLLRRSLGHDMDGPAGT